MTLGTPGIGGSHDFSPVGYTLDLTSYFNSVLPRDSSNRVAIRFDVLNEFSELAGAGGNHGFGVSVSFSSLDYVEGPPPTVPLPASGLLLGAALAGMAALRRRFAA